MRDYEAGRLDYDEALLASARQKLKQQEKFRGKRRSRAEKDRWR